MPGVGSTPPDEEASWEQVSSVQMLGNWTYHAYKMSHDGSGNLIYLEDGFEVHYRGRKATYQLPGIAANNPREVLWHPDNKMVVFWAPPGEGSNPGRKIALMRLEQLPRPDSGEKPYEVIYDPGEHDIEGEMFMPFGMEWSPTGKAIYVLGRIYHTDPTRPSVAALKRMEWPSRSVSEIVRVPGQIDFFMPPISRFENGGGPSSRPYSIIYGTGAGLFTTDPKGKELVRVSTLPAVGLHNVEWHPQRNMVVLYFKRASPGVDGRSYRGVWLVDLDKVGQDTASEQLHEGTDIHTLWFSPQGTFVTWASEAEIGFRRPDDPPEKATYIEVETETGAYLDIKGMSWHDSEQWLAFTAGNRLFIYDVKAGTKQEVAQFGPEGTRFAAEPVWQGNRVFLTVFEDLRPQYEEIMRRMEEQRREQEEKKKEQDGSGERR